MQHVANEFHSACQHVAYFTTRHFERRHGFSFQGKMLIVTAFVYILVYYSDTYTDSLSLSLILPTLSHFLHGDFVFLLCLDISFVRPKKANKQEWLSK